jgi:hypothetical protein
MKLKYILRNSKIQGKRKEEERRRGGRKEKELVAHACNSSY